MKQIFTRWLAVAAILIPAVAWSQSGRTVTLLVPFTAGGTVDIVARLLSKDLSAQLGQTVVIDNRPGAGGTMASALLARATPDGSTLMVHHVGATFNPVLYDKLPFDTRKDLVPVAFIGATPNVLVVTNGLPVKTVGELIAYAKAHPGKLSYASAGVGSASHVAMESLMAMAGIRMTHIPYKGGGQAMTDLISGQVDVMLQSLASVKPFVDHGQARALATSGLKRSEAMPSVPTIDEAGVKGFEFSPWYGLFAPPGTPADTLDRIHDAMNKALGMPENQRLLAVQGMEVQLRTRQQFADVFHGDLDRWGKLIRALNIKGE